MDHSQSLMFINPKSGSLSQQLTPQELRTKLEGYDLNPEIHIGENGEAIKKFIRQVQVRRPSCVLVAGGDGTIGSVLKGLIDMKCTFGIIPAGSLNNLAGTLGLSGDIDQALEVIKQGKTRRIDAARVGNDIMFEALGLGMFAEILDKTDWDTDKNVGQLVARSAVQVVTQQPITVNAVIDGKSRHFETIWLAVANTQKIGALTLDPTSSPDDGKLELLYCRPLNALELPAYAVKFLQGDHLEVEKFERIQGKHISLSFPHDTVVHIDDQIYHRSRLEVTVLPRILELFAP